MKRTTSVLAAMLLASAPALGLAQLTIDPAIEGAAVSVTGSGANANGYVELFVNGSSAGSVQADGSGDWSITTDLVEGDVLTAIPARVWNFNTDGDAEGWFSPDDIVTVDGGVMTVTEDEGGNMTIAFSEANLADPTVQRVLEFRYRYTGTVTAPGVILTDNADEDGPWGPNWTPTPGDPFKTVLIDLTDTFTVDGGTSPNAGWSGDVSLIGIGFNGTTADDTMEIDFVRLRETYRWDFATDGDAQGWVADPANTTIAGVADGWLTATATADGVNIALTPAFQQINPSVFNQYNIRMIQNTDSTEQPVQVGGVSFFNNGWSGFAAQFAATDVYTADYGNPIEVGIDLSANAEWNNPIIALNLADNLMVAPDEGDSVEVDFIEFAPETVIGDAAPVTVSAETSVNNWTMFH